MPELRDYTVIVYPPPPVKRDAGGAGGSYTVAEPNRVVIVKRVRSPEEAAAGADVRPGGRAQVVVEAKFFTRAEQAPLEEVDDRFQSLPQAAAADPIAPGPVAPSPRKAR